MTQEERKEFLVGQARTAKVATVHPERGPHVTPVWFDVEEDGTIVFTTLGESVKGRALRHDPRVALCVDDDRPPFAFVMMEGRAQLSDDPMALRLWATRIGGRYMGADQADAFGRRNSVAGELLVRVTPTRVVARSGVSD